MRGPFCKLWTRACMHRRALPQTHKDFCNYHINVSKEVVLSAGNYLFSSWCQVSLDVLCTVDLVSKCLFSGQTDEILLLSSPEILSPKLVGLELQRQLSHSYYSMTALALGFISVWVVLITLFHASALSLCVSSSCLSTRGQSGYVPAVPRGHPHYW